MKLAYPDRDVGGWDLDAFDARAAEFIRPEARAWEAEREAAFQKGRTRHNPRPVKGAPTPLNVWSVAELMSYHGGLVPARVAPVNASAVRKLIKAGWLVPGPGGSWAPAPEHAHELRAEMDQIIKRREERAELDAREREARRPLAEVLPFPKRSNPSGPKDEADAARMFDAKLRQFEKQIRDLAAGKKGTITSRIESLTYGMVDRLDDLYRWVDAGRQAQTAGLRARATAALEQARALERESMQALRGEDERRERTRRGSLTEYERYFEDQTKRRNPPHDMARRARAGLRQTARERDAALAHAHRAKVADLKRQIAELGAKKRAGLSTIRKRCQLARARVAAARKAATQTLREARTAAQNRCSLRKQRIAALTVSAVEKKRQELDAERAMWRDIQLAERRIKKAGARRSKREAAAESDDEVRANIPAELVHVFNRVRRSIKPREGMSRTEAFLHWAEENPEEVYAHEAEAADRATARLVAELKELERQAHQERRAQPRKTRAHVVPLAEAVPF